MICQKEVENCRLHKKFCSVPHRGNSNIWTQHIELRFFFSCIRDYRKIHENIGFSGFSKGKKQLKIVFIFIFVTPRKTDLTVLTCYWSKADGA